MAAFRPLRLLLFAALFLALSGAGTWAIYAEFAGRELALDARLLDGRLLAAVAALLLVYFAADGLRLYFTMRALGCPVPLRQGVRLVFINLLFSNITPMATGGGFAQIWFLRRQGVPIGTATAATTVRTLLAVAFIFAATPAVLYGMEIFDGELVDRQLLPYLSAFAALYLGFFAVAVLRTRWLLVPVEALLAGLRRARLLGEPRRRRWRLRVRRELVRFRDGFRSYLAGPPRDILLSVLFTAVFLLSLFSFPALLLWGLGYAVDYGTVLALLVVTTFVMYCSPTPGASGIAEGVFGHFFAGMVSAEHLVLVTLAWRFLTIFLGMGVGVFVTLAELSSGREGERG
ncbi:flippase-like domain-containing protein [Halorhodospira neutriphila]|uniref:flippase-like domain-containing protein n=1 Tax=Halorhodospira neutriphila TaxID=168379 RepID=UPI001A9190FE